MCEGVFCLFLFYFCFSARFAQLCVQAAQLPEQPEPQEQPLCRRMLRSASTTAAAMRTIKIQSIPLMPPPSSEP